MKSKTQLIIQALKTGKAFSLSEMTSFLSELAGQTLKRSNVSPVLARLSKAEKTEIGFFIQRRKKPKTPYQYKLVAEALELSNEELFDLSRKKGKNRFTLDDAVRKYPGLKKYVKSTLIKSSGEGRVKLPRKEKGEAFQEAMPPEHSLGKVKPEFGKTIRAIQEKVLNITINLNIRLVFNGGASGRT